MNSRAECHHDETPVPLNADQTVVVEAGYRGAVQAVAFVAEMAKKGSLTVSIRANGLGVAFAALDRVAAAVGFESDREADHKSTQKVLRAANERIRELEKQLAGSVTGEALAQAVKKAVDSIYPTWKKAGFNYASDISAGPRYLSAKLHCDALHGIYSYSDTPDSDEKSADELRANLEGAGIVFSGEGRRSEDRHALDTDANKAAIIAVIRGIWPEARITNWTSHYSKFGSDEDFTIRYVEVLIPIESLVS
ncbi:hypothetical protein SH661x_001928 [Planctomicrobium sp. SH661]|uniref:hypothetical protein n=1 Tax=Planctomicrobium sp. SH661 TaxID=3448124 RepID=UPI003F5C9311